MENDKDFERILAGYIAQLAPSLNMFLQDSKVSLVQTELERVQGGLLQYARIFDVHGKLLPLSTLLLTNRKNLLADVKILLPFWYSSPLIAGIIRFFKRLKAGKKKRVEKNTEEIEETKPKARSGEPANINLILKRAAIQFQTEHVPEGQTVEQYLASMEKRWRKILDETAHKQLSKDIQALIKKKLQRMMSIRTGKQVGVETIMEVADSIVIETPALANLDSADSMKLYVALYVSKILKNS
jgi:hypothetical protein